MDDSRIHLNSADRAILRALGIDSDVIHTVRPISPGFSGARLHGLTLEYTWPGGARSYVSRVFKRLTPRGDWLAQTSQDLHLREVQLHATGLLASLPHTLATGTIAWWQGKTPDGLAAGGLLMADETPHLLRNPLQPPPGRLPQVVRLTLDRLAHLHASFWCDPQLAEPAMGLTPAGAALLLTAPRAIAARLSAGDTHPYLPLAAAGWDAFFRIAPPSAAAVLQAVLDDPEPYITAIQALPRTLVHGDVWGPNLGWLPPGRHTPRTGRRLLLLDWALATAGPATYDPLWLCGGWHRLNPVAVLATYRARLERHLTARGRTLAPTTWHTLADAGYLRTALTCGEALGRTATEAPPGAARGRAEDRVRWWATRAAQAARRLVPSSVATE